jgi:hypothetical protein
VENNSNLKKKKIDFRRKQRCLRLTLGTPPLKLESSVKVMWSVRLVNQSMMKKMMMMRPLDFFGQHTFLLKLFFNREWPREIFVFSSSLNSRATIILSSSSQCFGTTIYSNKYNLNLHIHVFFIV